jgi:hypothetical protein
MLLEFGFKSLVWLFRFFLGVLVLMTIIFLIPKSCNIEYKEYYRICDQETGRCITLIQLHGLLPSSSNSDEVYRNRRTLYIVEACNKDEADMQFERKRFMKILYEDYFDLGISFNNKAIVLTGFYVKEHNVKDHFIFEEEKGKYKDYGLYKYYNFYDILHDKVSSNCQHLD